MVEKLIAKLATHALAILVGVALTFGVVSKWYTPGGDVTLFRIVERPYVADRSDVVRNVPASSIPVELQVLKPTPKQEKKIEKELGGELPPGPLVSVNEIKTLPYGGNVVLSLPEVMVDGVPVVPEVTIYPNKKPFFEWINKFEVEVGMEQLFYSDMPGLLERRGPYVDVNWSGPRVGPGIVVVGVHARTVPVKDLSGTIGIRSSF